MQKILFGAILLLSIVAMPVFADSITVEYNLPCFEEMKTFTPQQESGRTILPIWLIFSCSLEKSLTPDDPITIEDVNGKQFDVKIGDLIRFLTDGYSSVPPTQPTTAPVEDTPSAEPLTDEEIEDVVRILCFGGQEQSYAYQAEYAFDKIVRAVKRDLTKLDRLAEECWAIENHILPTTNFNYRSLIVRENTDAIPTEQGLKMSKGSQVDEGKLMAEEMRAMDYIFNRSYLRPLLADILNPFASLSDPLSTYQRSDKQISSDEALADKERAEATLRAEQNVCQVMFRNSGYGGTSITWWADRLLDGSCDDKLDSLYMETVTNGKYSSLSELRNEKIAKLELEATLARKLP